MMKLKKYILVLPEENFIKLKELARKKSTPGLNRVYVSDLIRLAINKLLEKGLDNERMHK